MLITLENVHFRYRGKIPAVNGISLEIDENEIIGLVGPNGAGKSTLAKLLAGFIRPTSGKIHLGDKQYHKLSIFEISKTIGYLFQNPDVMLCTSSIFDDVSIGLKRQNLPKEKIEEITLKILKFLGIYEIQKFHPRRLSQGEKRRVNLGFILASRPKVIILDEPFAALDYNRKNRLLLYLKKLKKNHTIILISHDIESILDFCQRLIILNEGRVVYDDNVSKLNKNPRILLEVGINLPFFFRLLEDLKIEQFKLPSKYESFINLIEEKIRNAK